MGITDEASFKLSFFNVARYTQLRQIISDILEFIGISIFKKRRIIIRINRNWKYADSV